MKKKYLRIAVVICIAALLMNLAACANPVDEDNTGNGTPGGATSFEDGGEMTPEQPNAPESEETQPETPEELTYTPPVANYGGAPFRILEWSYDGAETNGYDYTPWVGLDTAEVNGNVINDIVYERNDKIEDTYNVVITSESKSFFDQYFIFIANAHMSGDVQVEVFTINTANYARFGLEPLCADYTTLSGIDLTRPWWDDECLDEYAISNYRQFITSSHLLRDKGATAAIYYNADLAEASGNTNLYDLVVDGKWTWENYITAAEKVKSMDGAPAWGAVGVEWDALRFYGTLGDPIAHYTDDGKVEYLFGSEPSLQGMSEVFDRLIYSEFYGWIEKIDPEAVNTPKAAAQLFAAEDAMFLIGNLSESNYLDGMTAAWSILPLPKYSEEQDRYYSWVDQESDSLLGIAGVSAYYNADMICNVLELMGYYSYLELQPAFYETLFPEDDLLAQQSHEMLDLIFATRMHDPGLFVFNVTGRGTFIPRIEHHTDTSNIDVHDLWENSQYQWDLSLEILNGNIRSFD